MKELTITCSSCINKEDKDACKSCVGALMPYSNWAPSEGLLKAGEEIG